jgi:hypothetical protein
VLFSPPEGPLSGDIGAFFCPQVVPENFLALIEIDCQQGFCGG